MDEHIKEITKVLIFKDGYYYLTVNDTCIIHDNFTGHPVEQPIKDSYRIAPDELAIYNGFEFASDAYAYLAKLQEEKKAV